MRVSKSLPKQESDAKILVHNKTHDMLMESITTALAVCIPSETKQVLRSAALPVGLPLPWRLPTRLSHDFILHHDFMGAGRRVYQVVVLRILLGRSLPVSPTAALSLPLPLQLLSLRAFLSNRCLLLNNACHH